MRSGRHRLIVLLRRTRRRATQGRLHGKYTLQAARTPEYTRLCPNRTSRDITQEELAVRLGLASKQHVSRMENGKRSCSIDLLIELSCILHVSTDYLLMGSEPSKEGVKNNLLSIISELSRIAKKIQSCSAFGNDKIEILLARFDVISNEATEIFLCQVRKI